MRLPFQTAIVVSEVRVCSVLILHVYSSERAGLARWTTAEGCNAVCADTIGGRRGRGLQCAVTTGAVSVACEL